jgi:four helix bundle protein
VQNYKRLEVWRKAHALLLNVDRATRRFPREYANLRSQLRRAAESIPANIVEGCGRSSQKEFANYLQTSFSSANELEYHLLVARDYGLLLYGTWNSLTDDTIEVRMMLASLIKKVRGN